jgi:5'-nucleotidase
MKKLIFTIFALAALSVTAVKAQDLVILHLNDTHSHIDPERSGKNAGHAGVVETAAYVDEVRAEVGKKNVLLLHAGDFSQGTSYFTELNGDMEIEVLNSTGYDVVCLGNHEFDNGMEALARRLGNLKADVVCANYDFSATPLADYVEPYVIVRRGGLRIGIIGLLADVADVVDSRIAAQLQFQDPAACTQKYADYLKDVKKCDLVICLSHLGYDGEPYTDVELAAQTRNVDIIVGGHSHTKLKDKVLVKNLDGEDVVIVQDGKWGLKVGRLDIEM